MTEKMSRSKMSRWTKNVAETIYNV